ncbi:MAG: helix-turn-helix transcriptional regulator [Planctomycetaceae bacterium]|nr:helix-turn-helix transcriptional regulator [Planctomycetaceae bacterium]
MKNIGSAVRDIRELVGFNQRAAAEDLGISNVHLCNIENEKSVPSPELLDRIEEKWGVHPVVYAWCQSGSISSLPKSLRETASKLSALWREHIARDVSLSRKRHNSDA